MIVQEKRLIQIVEDEAISAMDLKTTLISLGYQVTGIASSGEPGEWVWFEISVPEGVWRHAGQT